MPNINSNKTQIIIVSGFLGAGKTTFIQKLASSPHCRGTTVILENEFGDVDLDGAVLRERGFSVVSVQGGCICCTGVGDFAGAIQEAVGALHPDRIIIEPTGVAKLSLVLAQFGLPPLLHLCEVEQSITVADARNFERRMLVSEEFYENQLKSSNVILLSKTEGMAEDDIAGVADEVQKLAPQSLLVVQPWETLTEEQQETCLLYRKPACHHGHGHHDHEHGHERHHEHDHEHHDHDHADHVFATVTLPCERTAAEIGEIIGAMEPGAYGTLLRAKGVARSADGLAAVDYVPGDLRATPWEGEAVEPFLTFIGVGLKEEALRKVTAL